MLKIVTKEDADTGTLWISTTWDKLLDSFGVKCRHLNPIHGWMLISD